MIKSLSIALLAVASFHAADASAAENNKDSRTRVEHNFSSNGLGPFSTTSTSNGNYVIRSNNRMKVYWAEENYQNNRRTRGAEIRVTRDEHDLAVGEYWTGFSMLVPDDFPSVGGTIVHQNFQNGNGTSGWFAVMVLQDDDIILSYRERKAASAIEDITLVSNYRRDRTYNFILRMRPEDRRMEVWVDGSQKVNLRDVNVGFEPDQGRGCKWGMYTADVDNYIEGEERILYFDNIAHWLTTKNRGYDIVDPTQ